MWSQSKLPSHVHNVLEVIGAVEVAGMPVPAGEPSHQAAVVVSSGILLEEHTTLIPVEYNGETGYTLVSPIGIYLSAEEYAWVVQEMRRKGMLSTDGRATKFEHSVMSNSDMSTSGMSDEALDMLDSTLGYVEQD